MSVTPLELARVAAAAADEKKATDICLIDISNTSDICDYFLIASAANRRLRVECGVALHSDFHSGQRAALIIRNSACDRTLLSVQGRGRQQEDRYQKYFPFHCQNSKGYT